MRRAQAAMEFAVSYGWMMMAALVVIGALTYFGVTGFDKYLPSKCSTDGLIHCTEFKIAENGAQIMLRNNLGQKITGMVVTLEGRGQYQGLSQSYTLEDVPAESNTELLTLPIPEQKGKFIGAITIVYQGENDNLQHTITGQIAGPLEPTQIPISIEIPEPPPEPNSTIFPIGG